MSLCPASVPCRRLHGPHLSVSVGGAQGGVPGCPLPSCLYSLVCTHATQAPALRSLMLSSCLALCAITAVCWPLSVVALQSSPVMEEKVKTAAVPGPRVGSTRAADGSQLRVQWHVSCRDGTGRRLLMWHL